MMFIGRHPVPEINIPPFEGESFAARWPEAPSVADTYRMGGLAAMDQYREQPAGPVFEAYDRAEAQRERDRLLDAKAQRAADFRRDQYGPADIRGFTGLTPSQQIRSDTATIDAFVPGDVLGGVTLLSPSKLLGGIGNRLVGAGLGVTLGADPAEAAGVRRLPPGAPRLARGAKAIENWRLAPDTPPPIGHNRPPPERPLFPEYAEEYPAAGSPEWRIDKNTGEGYFGKQLTPEAKAFAKARENVIEDMQRYGYEPFFDVSKRSNVDPANYPPNVDTTTIIPKKQATIDKHMAEIGSDEARARLQAAYARGKEMPNTDRWYALKQLEDEFIKELGVDAGRKAFQDRVATSMAATTGGADPTSNFLMAMYGNYLRNQHPDVPWSYVPETHQMPYPIGGRYAAGNMAMHEKVFDQGGFAALGERNPKRHNFSQDFTGNLGAGTMDEQMVSGMTPGKLVPPKGTYGLYERVLAEEAAKVGVPPAEFQGIGWSGFKNMKDPTYTQGKPFIEHINESIERTHRLTGMPKDEIMRRGLIYGQIPMYAVMGSIGLGALAEQGKYDR